MTDSGDPLKALLADATAIGQYTEALRVVERLHRRLLDVVKDEFERRGRDDVTSAQALLIYNIGDRELTASELRTRGYYLGSNVSFHAKRLVETGYLREIKTGTTRRSARIGLSEKGAEIHDVVSDAFTRHAAMASETGSIRSHDLVALAEILGRLEQFWTNLIRYRL